MIQDILLVFERKKVLTCLKTLNWFVNCKNRIVITQKINNFPSKDRNTSTSSKIGSEKQAIRDNKIKFKKGYTKILNKIITFRLRIT